MTQRDVDACLSGNLPYDDLDESDQALVRRIWDRQITSDIAAMNLRKEFEAAGDAWVVGDGNGGAVWKTARSSER